MPEEIKKEELKLSLEEKLNKNLQWSQLIYEQNRKISRRLTLMVIVKYIWLAIVIIPIILGIIYLPTFFDQLMKQYGMFFQGLSHGGAVGGGIDLSKIIGSLSEEQINGILKMMQK